MKFWSCISLICLAGVARAETPAPVARLNGVLRSFSPNGRYAVIEGQGELRACETSTWRLGPVLQKLEPGQWHSAVLIDNQGQVFAGRDDGLAFVAYEPFPSAEAMAWGLGGVKPEPPVRCRPTFDDAGNLKLVLGIARETSRSNVRVYAEKERRNIMNIGVAYGDAVEYCITLKQWEEQVHPFLKGKNVTGTSLSRWLDQQAWGATRDQRGTWSDPSPSTGDSAPTCFYYTVGDWGTNRNVHLIKSKVHPALIYDFDKESEWKDSDVFLPFPSSAGHTPVSAKGKTADGLASLRTPTCIMKRGKPWTIEPLLSGLPAFPLTQLGAPGFDPHRLSPDGKLVALTDGNSTRIYPVSVVADPYANLDEDVLYDLLMEKIVKLLKDEGYAAAQPYFNRLETGASKLPESFYFYQMEALEKGGQKAEARLKAEAYLARFRKKGKYYAKVIALMARL